MKKWMIFLCVCLIFTGCSQKTGAGNGNTEEQAGNMETESKTPETESTQEAERSADYQSAVEFLEQFEPELEFHDMDEKKADEYVGPLKDAYEVIGRETEDGFGYVLAVLTEEASPLKDLAIAGMNDVVTALDVSGEKDAEVYRFEKVEDLYQGEANRVLYFQPEDLTAPEELSQAFLYRYCRGENGVNYLADVMARGVRLTPPESGAYLCVARFENGCERVEYVPLSGEEEQEILKSDELISPIFYGGYGIRLYVSEEEYEKNAESEKHISAPALAIAKEKCRFEVVELSEIHDIVRAELKMKFEEWDGEKQTVASVREEKETLTDPQKLAQLEQILTASELTGNGKCPFNGILTLTEKDGKEIVLQLATDSCDGFILGSLAFYSPGKEMTAQLWDLFPGMRENTGWRKSN